MKTPSSKDPQAQAETTVRLPVRLSPRGDYLKDAGDQTLADLRYHTAQTEAKELIVRAVNCHAELLAALKAMTTLMQQAADEIDTDARHPLRGYGGRTVRENIHDANAAISKAEIQP